MNHKKPRQQLERVAQVSLVNTLRIEFPDLLFWATPNGFSTSSGKGVAYEKAKMKREGLLKGVPDLFFPTLLLFIETKAGKNTESKAQKAVRKELESAGYVCKVCYSALDAMKAVLDQMVNLGDMTDEQRNMLVEKYETAYSK